MNTIDVRKLLQKKCKEFNASIRGRDLFRYAVFGAVGQHIAERIVERVDFEDREKVIDTLINYVSRNNEKLSMCATGEEVTIANSKYILKLTCIPSVRNVYDSDGGATTQVLIKTIIKTHTGW